MCGCLYTQACGIDNNFIGQLHACRSQETAISQSTGCKGSYSLMKLPFHDPLEQTVPDAMHTIKDAVEHLFNLITGKEDSVKVRAAEVASGRFGITSSAISKRTKGAKKPDVPYLLTPEQISIANQRALSIRTPAHIDYVSKQIFSKTAGLKSHDWKQVIHTLHVYRYCLQVRSLSRTVNLEDSAIL